MAPQARYLQACYLQARYRRPRRRMDDLQVVDRASVRDRCSELSPRLASDNAPLDSPADGSRRSRGYLRLVRDWSRQAGFHRVKQS